LSKAIMDDDEFTAKALAATNQQSNEIPEQPAENLPCVGGCGRPAHGDFEYCCHACANSNGESHGACCEGKTVRLSSAKKPRKSLFLQNAHHE